MNPRRLTLMLVTILGLVGVFGVSVFASNTPADARVLRSKSLFTFDSADEPGWSVVNDGVMGGVSSSQARVKSGVLRFSGRVRLENNGGFASMRSAGLPGSADADFADSSIVAMQMRGDGRTYRITLDTPSGWYWATVRAPKAWTTLEIPYSEFVPYTRFGEVRGDGPFDGRPVNRIGVLVYNKKAERFAIEIDSITLR